MDTRLFALRFPSTRRMGEFKLKVQRNIPEASPERGDMFIAEVFIFLLLGFRNRLTAQEVVAQRGRNAKAELGERPKL